MLSPELRSIRRRSASSRRGAVFVEALLVIAFLALGFLGLVFFRELYVKQLEAARLARASVIAYSMTGCGNDNQPAQWIGRGDLGTLRAASPSENRDTATPAEPGRDGAATGAGQADSRASEVMKRVGGTSAGGEGLIHSSTSADVSGRSAAETREGGRVSGRQVAFRANPRSRSFVSCSDPVREGFGDVLDKVKGLFPIPLPF
jgi:hypothetical protein